MCKKNWTHKTMLNVDKHHASARALTFRMWFKPEFTFSFSILFFFPIWFGLVSFLFMHSFVSFWFFSMWYFQLAIVDIINIYVYAYAYMFIFVVIITWTHTPLVLRKKKKQTMSTFTWHINNVYSMHLRLNCRKIK